MKPIPAPSSQDESSHDASPASAAELLKATPSKFSNTNRRSPHAAVNRAYPWLLAASTAVAIFFALLYINKQVIVVGDPSQDIENDEKANAGSGSNTKTGLLPNTDGLPGETGANTASTSGASEQAVTTAPVLSRFEETNMRVQHILTAKSEDGHVSRIDLEVPVLYQSRQLRWTPAEVAEAQDLLVRLMDYQDKSRQLRSQGEQLLIDWNGLIGKSIPASRLRADSPSVPSNQDNAIATSGPADTTTRDAVEIQSKDQP